MASVSHSAAPHHHHDPRKPFNAPKARSQQVPPNPGSIPHMSSKPDPFYGHEVIARTCARFITFLFTCPELPPSSTQSQQKLPYFIAYALHRTKLHASVTFAALMLLNRLKNRFPTARGSSGHRLFISAFMISSKVICDDTYSNKSWSIVAQGMFTLREINQMEREMCNYLDWELMVDNPMLHQFELAVIADFSKDSLSYPTFPAFMVSKRAQRSAASSSATPMPEPNTTTSPIPFGQQQRNASPSKPRAPTSSPSHAKAYHSPTMPDTPSPSHSTTTSPASSASPATPISHDDYNAKIRDFDSSPGFTLTDITVIVHPLKGQMFSQVKPSLW
ncbi:hypothetical protein BDQ12DRAFT_673770 [Crucibulum laeve]|uniref:Cyclin N-terminal domain-containing protein n=1 Tax=Crucibulum laeve TaxID=68775 RepID=A0A5C3MJN2_9AGAR|nr:hypothetical protein BDQ12DRAFT_673770 [Crucibulum laeve]